MMSKPGKFSRALALLSAFCWQSASAQIAVTTLPTGGTVAAGTASISTSGSNMQITQGSSSAILNWQTFSIGSSAWVNFAQPSASAIALNRVLGSNPSEIYGRLTANGQVFFSNPNGILFGRGAAVDVGNLFATTLSITDQDFLAGRYSFYNAGNAGSVVNQGVINVNGYAALAAPQVQNDGLIAARAGAVALAAGDRVLLDMVGDRLISLSVDQAALNAAALNSGTITACGGTVLLTARSANALLDTVVNNSGVIRANSLVLKNGQIILCGGSAGVVSNTGTLQAAGVDAGTKGGTIKILGDKVGLFDGTRVDASGSAGGGTVLVGGNFQGAGPEANASHVYIGPDASINVDALTNGNGGNVAVWSNEGTKFFGTISTRGGAQGGDGGTVETSAEHGLTAFGEVALAAPKGKGGSWTLDPNNIQIVAGCGTCNVSQSGGNFCTTNDTAKLGVNKIQTALAGCGATVNIKTKNGGSNSQAGNICFCACMIGGSATGSTLVLQAANNITINKFIAAASCKKLNVTLGGLGCGAAPGVISMTPTGAICANGGNVTLNAAGGITLSSAYLGGATVKLISGGPVTQSGPSQIFACKLALSGNVNFTLTSGCNHIGFLAASACGHTVNYSDQGSFSIGSAGGLCGINVGSTGTVILNSSTLAPSTISQTKPIVAGGLVLNGNGTFNLLCTSNSVSNVAGSGAGTFNVTTNSPLTVANVAGTCGITAANATLKAVGACGSITLAKSVTASGTLNLDAATAINSTGGHFSANVFNATAGTGDITLPNGNSFRCSTQIKALNGSINLNASGACPATTVTVTTANASGPLTLSSNVGNLVVNAASGTDIAVTNTDSGKTVAVNNVTANGTLTLTTNNGQILQGGPTTISATGVSTVSAGTGSITLAGNNDFSSISLSGGAISVKDTNSLTVSSLTQNAANKAVTLVAGGTLTLPASAINAGTAAIDLESNGGSLATAGDLTGGNVKLVGSGGISIGHNVTAGGTLDLTATNNAINQTTGQISATGLTTVSAGSGAITIAQGSNDFSSISLSGAAISVNDANGVTVTSLTQNTANQPVTLISGGTLTLPASAINTGTAALDLESNGGTLATAGTLAGSNVTLAGSGGITLGHTLTATGTVALTSSAGNVAINNALSTTNTSSTAVVVSAGEGTLAPTATGGDVTIGGSGSISVGGGGRATLFTGHVACSTGVNGLVGNGSGNFRYGSDRTHQNYSLALGSGTYAIYRERPTLTIVADNKGPITYGDCNPAYTATVNNLKNGDTTVQALSTQPTVADDNVRSTAGYLKAGSRVLTASGAVDQLGYAIAYTPGTLTINKLGINATAIDPSTSVYGAALAPGAVTLTGVLGTDVVNGIATVDTSTVSSGNHPVFGTYTQSASTLGGADGGNYMLAPFTTATNNYSITQKALTVSAIGTGTTVYGNALAPGGATFSGLASGDTAIAATVAVDASTLSSGGHPIVGTYTQTASGITGTDSPNYNFTPFTTATNNYSITQRAIATAIGSSTSIYGNSLAPGSATTNFASGDTAIGSTVGVDTSAVSSGGHPVFGTYTQTASATGPDAPNYSNFTTATNNYSITQRAIATAIGSGTSVYGNSLAPGTATLNIAAGDTAVSSSVSVDTSTLSSGGHPVFGTYTQTASASGLDAGNYSSFTTASNNYSITQRAIATAIGSSTSIYGNSLLPGTATTNFASGDTAISSTVGVDTSTLSSGGHPVVGTYTQTASASGLDAGNYSSFTTVTNNYSITQRAIATAIGSSTSIYGNSLSPGTATTNFASGDTAISSTVGVDTSTLSSGGHPVVGTYTQTASVSGLDAGNYSSFTTASNNYSITQRAIATAIGSGTSVYGNSLSPGTATTNFASGDTAISSTVGVDTSTLSSGGHPVFGTYTQTASASGLDAANYSSFTTATNNYSITQRALTVTAIGTGTTVYGNALAPGGATFSGLASGDTAIAATVGVDTSMLSSGGHPVFGTYTQTASGITGTDAPNYNFTPFTTATNNYSITPRPLTVSAIGSGTTVYGNALTPGGATFSGLASGDTAIAATVGVDTSTLSSGGHPVFGTYTQTASGVTGTDAPNYNFTPFTTATNNYSITQRALTVTAIGTSTTVYGNALTPGGATFSGLASGDTAIAATVGVDTSTLSSGGHPVFGTYTQTASGITGTDAPNYSFTPFTTATNNYSVTQRALTVTAIGTGTTVYGNALAPGGATFSGLASGDTAVAATVGVDTSTLGSGGHAVVGTYTQTASGITGTDAPNYSFTPFTTATNNYSITQRALTVSAIGAGTTVYGNALAPGAATFSGLASGDTAMAATVGVDTSTLSTGGHPVAGTYTQTASGITGTDTPNYSFTPFTTATNNYSITQRALTVSAIGSGTTVYGNALTPGGATFSGLASGDTAVAATVGVNTSTLSSGGHPVVGAYTQTASGITGTDVPNYSFTPFTTATNNYSITQAALTVSAIGSGTTVYGNALAPGAATFSGLVSGDTAVAATVGVDASTLSSGGHPIVGTYTQTASGITGTDAPNYAFTPFTTATNNYSITQRAIASVTGITGVNKTYDGNTVASLTTGGAAFTNIAAGDNLTVATATGAFADKDVGAAKPVAISGIALGGLDAGNYVLSVNTAATTANIAQLASVTWTGAGGNSLWSNAANWAGSAIPDKANVANVNLGGANVTFDNTVPTLAGSVQVSNVSGGALTVASGTLSVGSAATLTGYTQSAGLTQVGGNLSITNAASQTGGQLVVTGTSSINTGAGAITLTSAANDFQGAVSLTGGATQITDANALTLGTLNTGPLTANSTGALDLGQGTIGGALIANSGGGAITNSGALSATGNASLNSGAAAITVTNADFGSLTFTGGAVSVQQTTPMLLAGTSTGNSVVLTSTGAMTNAPSASLTVTNNATFSGTSITLGNQAGDAMNFGSLTFNSAGVVSIAEDSATQLAGTSTANSLTLASTGALTNAASAALNVANNANLSATSIDLGNQAGDAVNFGSLTFNSAGAVAISEDSATQVAGANTANSLVLSSAGALTNAASASLAVTNNARVSGTSVDLGNQTGDAMSFGSLTFNSAGAVSITEDSATDVTGTNTASTLALASSGNLTNSGTITATTSASLTSGDQIIGSSAAAVITPDLTLTSTNGVVTFFTQTNALTLTNTNNDADIHNVGVLNVHAVNNQNGGLIIDNIGNVTLSRPAHTGKGFKIAAHSDIDVQADITANTTGTTVGNGIDLSAVSDATSNVNLNPGTTLNAGAAPVVIASADAVTALNTVATPVTAAPSITGGAVSISTSDTGAGITMPAVTTTGAVTANTSGGLVSLQAPVTAGSVNVTTAGGGITEAGAGTLTVSGTTSLQAGAGTITLASASNSFTGPVSATGTSGITIGTNGTLTPAVIDAGAASATIAAQSIGAGGPVIASAATLSSNTPVNGLATQVSNSLLLTGSASVWNITSTIPTQSINTTSPTTDVFRNSACFGGPTCGSVIVITSTIGSSVSQIAAQALKDAQATDSVTKVIDYGFAGDVGTTPPMDHRIEQTGIATPDCFEESREGSASCK